MTYYKKSLDPKTHDHESMRKAQRKNLNRDDDENCSKKFPLKLSTVFEK